MSNKNNPNEGANQWGGQSDDDFIPVLVKRLTLPAGKFMLEKDYNDVLHYKKLKDEFEDIVYKPTKQGQEILDSIRTFWDSEKFFLDNNIPQRHGILFYGTMGTGKTCLLRHIIQQTIEDNGIVFQGTPQENTYDNFIEALRIFRKIEPKRHLVCVFEEIDQIIEKTGSSQILGILDGESSVNYTLNIASTNHPDKLDPTIVNRPRRFDRIIEIGFPDEQTRNTFFKGKNLEGEELKMWVDKSTELSFAAMTELFVLVKAYGKDFDKSLARMKKMMVETPKLEKFRKTIGF